MPDDHAYSTSTLNARKRTITHTCALTVRPSVCFPSTYDDQPNQSPEISVITKASGNHQVASLILRLLDISACIEHHRQEALGPRIGQHPCKDAREILWVRRSGRDRWGGGGVSFNSQSSVSELGCTNMVSDRLSLPVYSAWLRSLVLNTDQYTNRRRGTEHTSSRLVTEYGRFGPLLEYRGVEEGGGHKHVISNWHRVRLPQGATKDTKPLSATCS